mgnify:CR=1 FL=1
MLFLKPHSNPDKVRRQRCWYAEFDHSAVALKPAKPPLLTNIAWRLKMSIAVFTLFLLFIFIVVDKLTKITILK